MKNNTTIFDIFQILLIEEVIAAATNEYKSFRNGSDLMVSDVLNKDLLYFIRLPMYYSIFVMLIYLKNSNS